MDVEEDAAAPTSPLRDWQVPPFLQGRVVQGSRLSPQREPV